MAKINRIEHCRKAQRCSKCGKEITVGSPYLKATPYHGSPIIRCIDCGLKSYETSGSYYVQSVGAIVEDWEENYELDESTAETIASDLEDIKSQCEESLDNIPDQLKDADAGTMLQERIEALGSAIDELNNIDYADILQEAIDSHDEEEEPEEGELEDEVKNNYAEAINEALGNLEY